MSIKAILRRITGKGGALNRATSTREVCRLSRAATSARVSIYEID